MLGKKEVKLYKGKLNKNKFSEVDVQFQQLLTQRSFCDSIKCSKCWKNLARKSCSSCKSKKSAVSEEILPSCFYECQGSYQGCCKACEF